MPAGSERPGASRDRNAAPWEQQAANQPAPRDQAQQHQAAQWQPTAAPRQVTGFSLIPRTRSRQIAVIVFLVVFFIGGPAAIAIYNMGNAARRETETENVQKVQEQLEQQQRAEAEQVLYRAVHFIKTEHDKARFADITVLELFLKTCKAGEFQTDYYEILQATLTGRVGPKAFDVVLVCKPKPSAANQETTGRIQFRWADELTQMDWH